MGALLVALTLAVTVTPANSAASVIPPGPGDDSFYVPPNPLPAGAPGDVIRWRTSTAGPRKDTVNAWQVMYLSTNALGQPDVVTGTILLPKNANPATAPVVALGVGTHGPAFRCTPSIMENVGALYEQPAVDDFLQRGYAVTFTDYEGYHPSPTTTYMNGKSMGQATIDLVRAGQRLPEVGLAKTAKVVFRGYSQGGGAAMWAGQLQPSYAPELNLVGVVGGGVPADLIQVALPLDGKQGSGLLFYALIGLNHAYSDLKLDTYLNDAGRAAFADMEQNSCTLELLSQYGNKKTTDYMTESPFLKPEWLNRVGESKLGATPIKVPVYQYHGEQDPLVDYSQAQTLHSTYCKAGVQVTWKSYPTDHITLVYTGNKDTLPFIEDRFAGKPATSNC